jgi:hypothetical protein
MRREGGEALWTYRTAHRQERGTKTSRQQPFVVIGHYSKSEGCEREREREREREKTRERQG